MMRIDVLTLFPEMFEPVIGGSILKRAHEKRSVSVHVHQLRDYAFDKHRIVDDYPFGGGAGMVMKVEPIVLAVEAILAAARAEGYTQSRVILLSPGGKVLKQESVTSFAALSHAVLICGHYEGIDERAVQLLVDEEVSIGDYVLTGGELPAMVWIDSVVRLIPGVLGSEESILEESFCVDGLLEYPHYTRPREFRGLSVPEVLLSGDHAAVRRWRRGQSLLRTVRRRPELLAGYGLTKDDVKALSAIEDGKEVLEWKSSETSK